MRIVFAMLLAIPLWYLVWSTETYWMIPFVVAMQFMAGFDVKIAQRW